MDNVDLQVLRQVAAWQAQGERVVLGTVTRTWGSAPRPVGSLVAINANGHIAGSVSGGCIEQDLVDRVRASEFVDAAGHGVPRVVRYGVQGDEAARFGLPCGGTLELVLEPVQPGPASACGVACRWPTAASCWRRWTSPMAPMPLSSTHRPW